MKKPDFLIIGAQKAGTSALSNMLSQHPLIEMAKGKNELKEIHYFDIDANYNRGLAWYDKQFETKASAHLRGEATPNYMFYERALARIKSDLPGIKYIVILRNPVARAISQINMLRHKDGHFIDILSLDKTHEVIARGMYSIQINSVQRILGADNMLILFHDDLVADPAYVMSRVCNFLSVPEHSFVNETKFAGRSARFRFVPRTVRAVTKIYKSSLYRLLPDAVRQTVHVKGKSLKSFLYGINADSSPSVEVTEGEKEHLARLYRSEIHRLSEMFPEIRGRWK